jgi:3,4-dihydroxy 2-butanone 4-phosphate synthase/GTP cyclohydrolase II
VLREGVREFASPWGRFTGVVYRDTPSNCLHIALVQGNPQSAEEAIVRVHEPVTVLDLLDIDQSTHSWPLSKALQVIANAPCGVAVLLNAAGVAAPSELKWLSQFEKLTQLDQHSDRKPSTPLGHPGTERKTDFRSYGIGAQILKDLGVRKMRLLANSSRVPSLSGYQLEIIDHIPYTPIPS